MKKPVTSYGSIDATLADTCSYYSSSAETSPESSSEDLITRSSSNNNNQHQHQHQHRPHGKASTSNAVLMVDYMSFSKRTRSKDRCYKYLLSLLLIIIIIILIVWLLLVVASSFLAAFWSHFHWKLPFWSSSQNIGQEQGVEEYDYIIVGAGPAGLVVAFHLAKRLQQESIKAYGTNDHAGKVLVLESGRESQSDVMKLLLHDGTSSRGFVKDAPRNDGNHYSQQQDKSSWTFVGGGLNKFDVPFLWSELSSRDDWSEYLSHHWPVDQTFLGRAVGGSGIHNAMINVRALPNDFQKWNVTNWSADEMMPYFDKLEDYHGTIPIVANYSPPLPKPFSRGSNGPLKTVVGGGMAISPLCAYFISSAVAAGFPLATLGFNDAEALNRIGVGFYEFNIRNGIRDSVAKALLSSPPQQQGGTSTIPSNLIIRTDATVHRVIFETLTTVPRAVGVEYYSNDQQTVGGSFRRHVRLRSSRSVSNLHPIPIIQHDPEVILSAGAILSSQILANSGISKGGFLVDSPNVGNNLQDHPVVAISYRVMGDLSNSISSFFQMDGSNSQLSFETYLKSFPNNNHSTRYDATNFLSNSVYGTAGFSVGGFLSSPWSKDGDHVPDIQITVFPHTREPHFMHNNHNLTLTAQQSSHNNTNSIANVTGTNILITVALLQPESRNSLVMAAAAAANDTTNSPEQSWSSLGNFPLPQIQGGSLTNGDASRLAWGIKQVRNIMSTSPLKDVIQYEQRPGDQCTQDQDLIQYVKDNVMRNAHWSGSTRMGNDDDDESDSVVDSRLRVRGVESLRIVDAGVMPLIPNGNTHSTTCVIALRAVDLILDQGLKE